MMSENSRSTLVLVFCFLMVTPAQLLGGNGSFIDTDKLQPITFAAFRCLVLHGKWVSHRKLPMIYIIRVIDGTSSPFRFLNLAAFRVPCTLNGAGTDVSNCLPGTPHYGSLPRNAFTGPKIRSLDLTLSKTTKLSERWFLEIRGDLFNVTNSPHFASPFLPHFIASAASKGLDLSGTGGAAGASCNTTSASAGCYLSLTNTPDSVIGSPNRSAGGP